jgi:hypothetical protein
MSFQYDFCFETDDNSLITFASEDEAISHCEGIDVNNGIWLFFTGSGTPLKAVFSIPPKDGFFFSSGKYRLEDAEGTNLKEMLGRVSLVSGCGLQSTTDIARLLEKSPS